LATVYAKCVQEDSLTKLTCYRRHADRKINITITSTFAFCCLRYITIGTHEDERTRLYKTKSLDCTKPNTNPKTRTKTNPNPYTNPNLN